MASEKAQIESILAAEPIMIKIKNKSNNIHELNHKFNMMLNAIIDSIDFTTILCEINHFYTAKGNKIKHLRKIIIGEELAL